MLGAHCIDKLPFCTSPVRPIFPKDIVANTTKRWMEFDAFVDEDITMSLSLRDMVLLDMLDTSVGSLYEYISLYLSLPFTLCPALSPALCVPLYLSTYSFKKPIAPCFLLT